MGQAVGAGSPDSNVVDKCIKCRLYFFTKVLVLPPKDDGDIDAEKAFKDIVDSERGRL